MHQNNTMSCNPCHACPLMQDFSSCPRAYGGPASPAASGGAGVDELVEHELWRLDLCRSSPASRIESPAQSRDDQAASERRNRDRGISSFAIRSISRRRLIDQLLVVARCPVQRAVHAVHTTRTFPWQLQLSLTSPHSTRTLTQQLLPVIMNHSRPSILHRWLLLPQQF